MPSMVMLWHKAVTSFRQEKHESNDSQLSHACNRSVRGFPGYATAAAQRDIDAAPLDSRVLLFFSYWWLNLSSYENITQKDLY